MIYRGYKVVPSPTGSGLFWVMQDAELIDSVDSERDAVKIIDEWVEGAR